MVLERAETREGKTLPEGGVRSLIRRRRINGVRGRSA